MRVGPIAIVAVATAAGPVLASEPPTLKALQNHFPGEDKELLTHVAHVTFDDALTEFDLRESVLRKDFSVACPIGWVDGGDGSKCIPPFGYQGACSEGVEFGQLDPEGKEARANECGATFPVLGDCVSDFSQACPEGWYTSAGTMCEAPSSYAGPCVRRKDFGRISANGKALFESTCAVRWPCRGSMTLRRAQDSLAKTCGSKCVQFLQQGVDGQQRQTMLPPTLGAAVANAERAASSAQQWLDAAAQGRAATKQPCASAASCAIKSLGANRCNYARAALQKSYEDLNVATHVLGTVVSSMCGCVRIGDVSSCLLKSMPANCAFPYTVYSKAFSTSVSVWEAVKAASLSCSLHVDPAIAA